MSLAQEVTVDRIIETFELLPDWENRYQFLDELGTRLDPMNDNDKTDENRVIECMSILHIRAKPGAQAGKIDFDEDCNTSTIKGVVALIIALFPCKCGNHPEFIPYLHGIASIGLFIILAFFCYFF